MTRRPLVLLPSSKGKAPGGDGPPRRVTAEADHPLRDARRTVLDTLLEQVPRLDDAALARLTGIGSGDVERQRDAIAGLSAAATLPARRRYTGVVHGNAGLAEVTPRRAGVDVRIVSALLGLVALHEPVPDYRLELTATLPGLGRLASFWRRELADHLAAVARDRLVWDLLPVEHRRAVAPASLTGVDVVTVAFLRPDGRAANVARAKVAKGRFVAALLADPSLRPVDIAGLDLGPEWRSAWDGERVIATSHH